MKYVLLIALLLLYLFGLKRVRPKRGAPPPAPPAAAPEAPPQQMVSCPECGLHLPMNEALPGRGGHFCSSEHRASFEARRGPY